jgi:hypothetical protein
VHALLTGARLIFKKIKKPLKNVTSDAKARQKFAKNRSLQIVNEDFEKIFNAAFASAVVIEWFLSKKRWGRGLLRHQNNPASARRCTQSATM